MSRKSLIFSGVWPLLMLALAGASAACSGDDDAAPTGNETAGSAGVAGAAGAGSLGGSAGSGAAGGAAGAGAGGGAGAGASGSSGQSGAAGEAGAGGVGGEAGAAGVSGGAGEAGAAGAGGGAGGAGGSGAGGTSGAVFQEPTGDTGQVVEDALADKVIGFYAVRTTTASIQQAPILGPTPSTSVAYGLGEIRRQGQGLSLRERGCRVEVQGGSVIMTKIDDKVPQSVPEAEVPFLLWQDGAQVRFFRAENPTALGAKLDNPASDPLPTSPTDPRVFDQEGDGHPGITVTLSGLAAGELYVVQRVRSAFGGFLGEGDVPAGVLQDKSEQSVIDSSNPLLKQNVPSQQDADLSKSPVLFVRLSESYDCARLLQEQSQLFP